jgi:hypothetical protein
VADPKNPEKSGGSVDPAVIPNEPELTQRLDALINDYNTRVGQAFEALKQKYFAVGLTAPSADVAQLGALVDQYAKTFAELAPQAKALSDAGKTALSQKLTPYLEDARKAADIYLNMVGVAVTEEGKRAAIMADAAAYQTDAIRSVNQTMQNAYAAANAAWSNELKS